MEPKDKLPDQPAELAVPQEKEREQALAGNFEDAVLGEIFAEGSVPKVEDLLQETAQAVQELVISPATEPGESTSVNMVEDDAPLSMPESFEIQSTTQILDTQPQTAAKDPISLFDISSGNATEEMEIQKELCASSEANKGGEPEELQILGFSDEAAVQVNARWQMAETLFPLVICEKGFNELLDSAMKSIVTALNAQAGSILEFDPEKQDFFFRASVGGGDPEQLKSFRVPAYKGIVGHVAESKSAILLKDLDDSDMQLKSISMSTGFETKSCLAAPILVTGQLYGVVELFNKQGVSYFTEKDMETLSEGTKMLGKVLEVRFLMAELLRRKG